MAYSDEQWERTRAYYESGQYSLSQISDKTGIGKSAISKEAKNQQWKSGEDADYIEAKIKIVEKKSTLSVEKINTLDDIADEAIRNKNLVYGLTQKALRKANELLDQSDDMNEINTAVALADRASLTLGVNQRHANSQVNIQNNQTNNNIEIKWL